MLECNPSPLLLASDDSALLAAFEPTLLASGLQVEIARSTEAALAAMTAPASPSLALLDAHLPATKSGMDMSRLLAAARAEVETHSYPIVLISDTVTEEWRNRLSEGVIDDLIMRSADLSYTLLRLEVAQRAHAGFRELEARRNSAALNAQRDALSGAFDGAALLSMLFRETDRVQRMKTPLSMVMFGIDGEGDSQSSDPARDDVLSLMTQRTIRLLRSYDLMGRVGEDEFLLALPGCNIFNATMLAERLRIDVFSSPFQAAEENIRLSACFGVAASDGRSPLVVLREAEKAMQNARKRGPGTVNCFGECLRAVTDPVAFLSAGFGEESLSW
jgi:two-component system cell cycle response regulator